MVNNKKRFSWAFFFWGILGYFFHRNHIRQDLPFWKCAGVDILVWMIVTTFLCRISLVLGCSMTTYNIIHMFANGFVGAWRFNKYCIDDYNEQTYSNRETIASICGVILCGICFIIGFIV